MTVVLKGKDVFCRVYIKEEENTQINNLIFYLRS
jgi:hypothetical protein